MSTFFDQCQHFLYSIQFCGNPVVSPQCTGSSNPKPLTFFPSAFSSFPQGPNGAGKTTAISMLCGLFEPSDGNAFVNGNSITNATELQAIHQTMGVCPQHDVLWSDLTAREHLLFYGRLKGEGSFNVGLSFRSLFLGLFCVSGLCFWFMFLVYVYRLWFLFPVYITGCFDWRLVF